MLASTGHSGSPDRVDAIPSSVSMSRFFELPKRLDGSLGCTRVEAPTPRRPCV